MNPECNLHSRQLPTGLAKALALGFELELRLGKTTRWSIAKTRQSAGCNHWQMLVEVPTVDGMGFRPATPRMCFMTKDEAIEYVEVVSSHFSDAVQAVTGHPTQAFSSN